MIGIIDYGVGNLRSVEKAFAFLGIDAFVSNDIDRLKDADGFVLPGVGAFADGIKKLKSTGIDEFIFEQLDMGKPLLGICLGMQLLFDYSEETNSSITKNDTEAYNDIDTEQMVSGLGIISGGVKKFTDTSLKIPQMGWNNISVSPTSRLFKDIDSGEYMYFVHSFYCEPTNKSDIAAETEYGIKYCSAVEIENVFATQFHPEKSGDIGLKILKNFNDIVFETIGAGGCCSC